MATIPISRPANRRFIREPNVTELPASGNTQKRWKEMLPEKGHRHTEQTGMMINRRFGEYWIMRKLWFDPFDVALKTSPSAKLRAGPRRLRASPCHPERNEGSEPSPTRPWLNQMLRAAQHDNSVEDVSHLVFLFILRRSMDPIRIHLFRLMSVVGRRTLNSV
jgi:hypothetical protein